MTRMSKSISLVLISSSLILANCSRRETPPAEATDKEAEQEKDMEQRSAGGGSGSHYHPWYYGRGSSWVYRGSSSRAGTSGSRPASTGSVRSGGFGSTGHAVGS
jgi:hypothetical protein